MFNKLLIVFFVSFLIVGCEPKNDTTPVNPTPAPVTDPTEPPNYEFKFPDPPPKPNQETAPKTEEVPQVEPSIKKNLGPIRYDKSIEKPWGYYDYCDKYPTRVECGGKK